MFVPRRYLLFSLCLENLQPLRVFQVDETSSCPFLVFLAAISHILTDKQFLWPALSMHDLSIIIHSNNTPVNIFSLKKSGDEIMAW